MGIPDNTAISPDIYPRDIDRINGKLLLCNMDEECYRNSPFLDHRMVRPDAVDYELNLDVALQRFGNLEARPAHYIFHNAFCCSTLFTRCINAHRPALVLREPDILLKVASIYRYANTQLIPNIDPAFIDSVFEMVAGMLCRRYDHNDAVIIKPTDAVNNIMHRLVAHHPGNTGCLIYSDIERFLVAMFKYPQRAQFAQVRVNELALDDARKNGGLRLDPRTLSPVQVAAYVWLLHMENFNDLVTRMGEDRVMVLNSEDFMADQPAAVLRYLDFTGVGYDPDELVPGVEEAGSSHSKDTSVKFDAGRRAEEHERLRAAHSADIDAAVEWARNMDRMGLVDRFA